MEGVERAFEGAAQEEAPAIRIQDQWWVVIVLLLLVVAIQSHQRWFLNFVHVFAAILWTGTDIFMGFVLGPIMRRLDIASRRALIIRLMPRMLFYMPTVAITTGTAGWYLVDQLGYLGLPFPTMLWVYGALAITAVMTVLGLGILLPTNLRVYFEMRKDRPDGAKIQGWMQTYVRVVAVQGMLQVAINVIMARFVTGL
ncbi:MAG: hypothetical protein HY675_16275 [Chloroflexi bacterium]|nr:hypothetical protein [Chloroflexota bacterium]